MKPPDRSIVIHGHFYQPPREDPWLDEVPREEGAAPYHDWNERVERECYRAVVAARVPAPDGRISRVVNALERISFDVGPTLLAWLEEAAPDTYRAILAADRASAARCGGHGNALAAPYHHVILPLASRRDKETEVRWGIADFTRRFGRAPEGMWLPETAVDDETLDVLAAAGVRFTILAPHQVATAPPRGLPGRFTAARGRTIAIFLYDGPISHDVAFGPLVRDAAQWSTRLLAPGEAELVAVATDGETFGHHHRFGEMALAAVLDRVDTHAGARLENFPALLARRPPRHEVTLLAPSSWSCPHGVERWRSECGCRITTDPPTQQRWRAPLRKALEELATHVHALFQREATAVLRDPWAARDAYGEVLSESSALDAFLERHGVNADPAARRRAGALLELERHALGMFTSCGWFFDDLGGLEGRQVLRYAARAIDLMGDGVDAVEARFRERLAAAESNDPALGTGRDIYDHLVRPRLPATDRVAAAYAAARALGTRPEDAVPPAFAVAEGDGEILVGHRRTGTGGRYRATVERPRPGQLRIELSRADPATPWSVELAELPERAIRLVTPQLIREILDLWLSESEAAALCAGSPLAAVASGALLRAVVALGEGASPMRQAEVTDLLDLLTLAGEPVPFDAQTAFHRLRASLPPEQSASLRPIGRRLGFA